MNNTITLKQAEDLIASVGKDVTVHIKGQPGIGKSTLLQTLSARFDTHIPVYIDCADLDLGDLAMPANGFNYTTTSLSLSCLTRLPKLTNL